MAMIGYNYFLGLYWKVHLMDPMTYAALFIIGTLLAAYFVAFAYKNTKFTLKHKIAQKREMAIMREVKLFCLLYCNLSFCFYLFDTDFSLFAVFIILKDSVKVKVTSTGKQLFVIS